MASASSEESSVGTADKAQSTEKDDSPIIDASLSPMDLLQSLISKFQLGDDNSASEEPEILLDDLSLDGIVKYMQSDKCKKIVIMCGAGISTSAGIPDFRSPGTGLYDNLQKYDLKNPQDIFDITYFQKNPSPFFALAKELYPGNFKPTPSHFFIKLLEQKGLLLRVYTQNIDTLEREADISDEAIIEAHGTFHKNHCIDCKTEYSKEWMKEKIFQDVIPHCTAQNDLHDDNDDSDKDEVSQCNGLVKPDIVFFGEQLPYKFFKNRYDDFQQCDLLIIMGTSLKVQPFASLVGGVDDKTPRLLFNREKCGGTDPMMKLMGFDRGLDFDSSKAYRDVAYLGDCDDSCRVLCEKLGWLGEFDRIIKEGCERPSGLSTHETLPNKSPSDVEQPSTSGLQAPSSVENEESKKSL